MLDQLDLDLNVHAPHIFAYLAESFATADAASLAAALLPHAAFRGWDAQRLTAAIQPHVEPTHAGEVVGVKGRLQRIDEYLLDARVPLRFNLMGLTIERDGRLWGDEDTAVVRRGLELAGISEPDRPVPRGEVEEAVGLRARASSYHPVQEYLLQVGATWDRQPRLDSLWVRYFQAPDSELHRALGACFALGAVRRVLCDGAPERAWWRKVDLMPILYGPQGRYKSTGLRTLAEAAGPTAFCDSAWNSAHRAENAMTLSGCWVWEIPELEGFDRAESNAIKAFVGREDDYVLMPYARSKSRHERRSVMAGTTNDPQPLKDPTGSRRHPVIPVGHVDVLALHRDRHQLWAEAVARALTSELHWLPPHLATAQAEANAQYEVPLDDVWLERVGSWLAKPADQRGLLSASGTFTLRQCFSAALAQEPIDERRLARVLAKLGVEQAPRAGGVRRYVFPVR